MQAALAACVTAWPAQALCHSKGLFQEGPLLVDVCMSQVAPLQAKKVWNTTCPPPGFDSLRPFDLAAFVGRPWYAQLVVRWQCNLHTPDNTHCWPAHFLTKPPRRNRQCWVCTHKFLRLYVLHHNSRECKPVA